MQELGKLGVDISLKVLLGNGSRQLKVHEILFEYRKNTETVESSIFFPPKSMYTPHSRSVGGGNAPFLLVLSNRHKNTRISPVLFRCLNIRCVCVCVCVCVCLLCLPTLQFPPCLPAKCFSKTKFY